MSTEITDLEKQFHELSQKLSQARQNATPTPVDDHSFATSDGNVTLSQLFGDRDRLLTIHNMGRHCAYCTLWADVLHGSLPMLQETCAVVLVSPDAPKVQQAFASQRGWSIRMVSDASGAFTEAMGMKRADGTMPGVSAFRRGDDGKPMRCNTTFFGPGDAFCPVWPFLDLAQVPVGGWQPR